MRRAARAGLMALLACPALAAGPAVRVGDTDVTLTVTDGVEAKPVALAWTERRNGWSGAEAAGVGLTVARRETASGLVALEVAVTNGGRARRLVQLALDCAPSLEPATARYWDGSYLDAVKPVPGPQLAEGPRPRGSMPLSAVGDGRRALLLGTTPETLISYAEPELDYRPGQRSHYRFAVRVVLEPGATEPVGFCCGAVRGLRWGLVPAVWQTYRDAFPALFNVADGLPDAVWGTSLMYQSWWHPPDLELMRRLRCTWDWCYVPFKRAGDMWGRPDEWTYEASARPFEKHLRGLLGTGLDMGKPELAPFLADRQSYFARYGYDAGQLFYTPSGIWVEAGLARQKFSDALVVNDELTCELSNWVTGYDKELLVQPTGTSYGERLRDDYRRIAENLDVTGFAFDVCVAGQRNYGPAAGLPIAGRSFDERGVFYDLGLAMVEQMRFIRGLDWSQAPFRRPLIIGAPHSLTVLQVDGALMELTLTGPSRNAWPVMRMSLGSKPGVIWKGYDFKELINDVASLHRADFLKVYSKLADYVTLKSFAWGLFPGYNYLPGIDKLQRELPLLVELVKDGWQPLCPVETSGEAVLWTGRYGTGPGTSVVVANPNDEMVSCQVTVHNEDLGDTDCVFIDRHAPAGGLAQSVADRGTVIPKVCPRRRPTAIRSVLGVRSPAPLRALARAAEDLDRVVVTVTLSAPEAVTARLVAPARRGYDLAGLTVNGTAPKDPTKTPLRRGDNEVRIEYRSLTMPFTRRQLDAFPFLSDEGRMTFQVVCPDPDRRDYRRVWERFDRYFRYYAANKLKQADLPALQLVTDAGKATTPARIELSIAPKRAGAWSLEGATLRLTAPDEATAVRLTEALLTELDRRYPCEVPFQVVYGVGDKTLTKYNLRGKTMSEALGEEGLGW